jgi:hypothetical protein
VGRVGVSEPTGPYRIRLRGPWEVTLIDRDGTTEPPRFAYIPAEWQELFGDRAGTGVFRRRFNRPTGLEPSDEVWIVLTSVLGEVDFTINGRVSSPGESIRGVREYNVTAELQEHNLIDVRVTDDPAAHVGTPGGLWETVYLEIRTRRTEGSDECEGM